MAINSEMILIWVKSKMLHGMKRISSNVMLVAAAATAFFSCQKQETFISDASQERLLTITSEKPTFVDKSRTEWNGETIQWSAGDKISVAYTLGGVWKGQYKEDEEVYTIPKLYKSKQLGDDTEVANFDVSVDFNGADASAEGEYVFYGVYPAPQETDFPNAPYATLEVPKTQTPEPNSFDGDSDLMIGVSVDEYSVWPKENVSMLWTRLVAHANITLKALNGADASEQVLSIKLTAQADAKLVGNLEVNLLNKEVAIGNASNVIELKGSNLAIDKDRNIEFWACLLPETLTSLTAVVETNKATYTRDITRISKTLTFTNNARNTLAIDMSTAERVEKVATAYYEKVTSQLEDWSGKYLIVFGNNAHATLENNKDLKATVVVAIEDDKIAASADYASAVMTVTKSGEKYNMSYPDGKYFAMTHNSSSSSTSAFDLEFIYTDNGVKIIGYVEAKENNYILYNNNDQYYRCYVDKEGQSGYYLPTLYRLSESNEGGGETPEQPTTPVLTVNPQVLEVEAAGGAEEITYSVENPVEGTSVDPSTKAKWITDLTTSEGKITFNVEENIETAERIATITLSYGDATPVDVTVKQAGKASEGGETVSVIDILTRETTRVSGTSYADWTYESTITSAKYAGNSAGGNESIQLRTTNSNSGVVTTASGGNAKKIVVTWHSETTANRILQVYGKNTPYTDATDLYNTDNQGTLLGTIKYGTSTELIITGDYQYVGLKSSSGAMYLTEIKITWETSGGSGGEVTPEPEPKPVQLTMSEITCSVQTANSLTFEWSAVANASNYEVTFNNGTPETVDVLKYEATGLQAGTSYTISVKAVGDGTNYTTSEPKTAKGTTKAAEQGGGDEPVESYVAVINVANVNAVKPMGTGTYGDYKDQDVSITVDGLPCVARNICANSKDGTLKMAAMQFIQLQKDKGYIYNTGGKVKSVKVWTHPSKDKVDFMYIGSSEATTQVKLTSTTETVQLKNNNDQSVATQLNVYEVNLGDNNSCFNIKSSGALWIYKLEVTYTN